MYISDKLDDDFKRSLKYYAKEGDKQIAHLKISAQSAETKHD